MFAQEEAIGEVLISVTGERCTVDDVIWEILEGGKAIIKKEALICVVLDMCRFNYRLQFFTSFQMKFIFHISRKKARDVGFAHFEIQDEDGLERMLDIRKTGFSDQILIIKSALFGSTASDTNSFTLQLTKAHRCQENFLGSKLFQTST